MNKIPLTEYQECILLTDYLNHLQDRKKIQRYAHIANETWTPSWGTKLKNKRLGVSAGFPDYLIVFWDHMIAIEMKRAKGGVVSQEQRDWLDVLQSVGISTAVCAGFDSAKTVIDQFI